MIVFKKFMGWVKCAAVKWTHDRFTLLIVLLAGLGAAHILFRTAPHGVWLLGDAVFFLSTAVNFLTGEGWRDFAGRPMTTWPPLFPLLLAAGGWIGLDPLAVGRFINATAFGLTILVAGGWLRTHLRAQWLVAGTTLIIAASLPLSQWASILSTDFPFAVLTLLALVQIGTFLTQRTNTPLWWAAVFTALAALTRYPGVALIFAGVLLLWPLARLKHTLVFGAVSSLPLLAALARNWAVSETLTGRYGKGSGQSLSDGLNQTVEVFGEWVVLPNAPDGVVYLLGLAIGGAILAGATVILHATRMHRSAPEAAPVYVRLGPALPFGAFSLIYLGFLVAIVPFTSAQVIDSRFLLPVYVPLLLTAVFLLDRFLSIEATGWRVAIRSGLAALIGLATLAYVGYSARENRQLTAQIWGTGYPSRLYKHQHKNRYKAYNAAGWQQSETLNFLWENPIAGRIYSNEPALLWFADRTAAPEKYRRLKKRWPEIETGAHIVCFESPHNRGEYNYSHTDLRALSGMETVAELADGFILRCTAAEPFDAQRHRARKQRYVNQLIQQADEQASRAGWHVYRTGRTLIYRKKPCVPADVQAKFVLHVYPVDQTDLPADHKQYDFENLDFGFNLNTEQVDDECTVLIPLPTYAIDRIRTGQLTIENRILWEAEFAPGR